MDDDCDGDGDDDDDDDGDGDENYEVFGFGQLPSNGFGPRPWAENGQLPNWAKGGVTSYTDNTPIMITYTLYSFIPKLYKIDHVKDKIRTQP